MLAFSEVLVNKKMYFIKINIKKINLFLPIIVLRKMNKIFLEEGKENERNQ